MFISIRLRSGFIVSLRPEKGNQPEMESAQPPVAQSFFVLIPEIL